MRVSAKPVSEMERKAESSATASVSGAKPVSEMEPKAESSATACERCEARERDGAEGGIERHGVRVSAKPVSEMERRER